jgi:peptidoglycan L-alanyl-D-glutamate endopeptidase CwlK
MPTFSKRSLKELETCHPDLVRLCNEAIKYYDFSVNQGWRGKEEQEAAFKAGNTQLRYPNSKHNKTITVIEDGETKEIPCSLAIDVLPYPLDWHDTERFIYMHGIFEVCAQQLGIKIRHGTDWNMNNRMKDEKFRDYPHIELV